MTQLLTSVVASVRSAAAASVVVRVLLVTVLAISVTTGGVLAGALVVAPIVSRAAQATIPHVDVSQARGLLADTRSRVRAIVVELPEPVSRFAVPVLALISIASGLVALFARRSQRPTPPMFEVSDSLLTARSSTRLTPRSSSRVHGNRSKTPRAVEALAASGASTTDIAWRTGLPIDAVRLLLALSTVSRQLHPPAA